jgi:methyl-accepting chemotaxis protein
MGNLSIRVKIRLAIAVLGVGYLALLALVLWTGAQTRAHMTTASHALFPAALSSQEAEAEFQKVIQHYSNAVLMQDRKALEKADESSESVKSALRSAQEQLGFEQERQKEINSILSTFDDMHSRSKSTYASVLEAKGNMSDEAMQSVSTLASDNKRMTSSLQELGKHISNDFQTELEAVTESSKRQRTLGLVFFFITATCAAFLAVMVERQVSQPLQLLTNRLKDIAEGEGDLTKRLEIVSKDELGEVSSWFNLFMDKLQNVMRQVASGTRSVAGASDGMNVANQQISANSEETSAQADVVSKAAEQVTQNLQTVTTGAEQMGESIKEIAKNATEAARIATTAVEFAQNTTAIIGKLGDSSSEIGNVLQLITTIAQQTNLLALNATIEAARAGDAGKGFAVVANEVKELAKATSKATEDIGRKVGAIQSNTKAAMDAIASISGVVNEINGISSTIAAAVEEQTATTDEMVRNVSEATTSSREITGNISGVAQAAQSTMNCAGDTQKAALQMVETSTELRRLVEQFKIDSATGGFDAAKHSIEPMANHASAGR